MNKKAMLFGVMAILMSLLISCGAPTTVGTSQPPIPTPDLSIRPVVVILIVDNFTNVKENLPEGGICTVTPDGQGLSGARGSSNAILGRPHGYYVYHEILNLVSIFANGANIPTPAMPAFNTSFSGKPWLKQIDYFKTPKGAITLVAVDTEGFNTVAIDQNMQAALDLFSAPNDVDLDGVVYPKADGIVVNMSYAYIPCDPMVYIASPLNLLNNKLGLNLTADDLSSLSNLKLAYGNSDKGLYAYINKPTNKDVDPLWVALAPTLPEHLNYYPNLDDAMFYAFTIYLIYRPDDLSVDGATYTDKFLKENDDWVSPIKHMMENFAAQYRNTIFIGAAGNSNLPYPYLPASLDSVVSLSSEGADIRSPCKYSVANDSNCGEINMKGVYFGDSTITGTSFAAPKFSYYAGLYLLNGGTMTCAPDINASPVLGYSDGSGPWDNMPLDASTTATLCASFPHP